jgi:molecular chaperone GrpE
MIMQREDIMDSDNKEFENMNEEKNENVEQTTEEIVEEVKEEVKEETKEQTVEEKLEAALAKADDNWDKYLRQLAEFENFRKRSNAEKAGMYNNGVRDVVEKLLPVIDNFERAIASIPEEEREGGVFKGVEMIQKQFLEIMTAVGVEEIPAEGEPFDPNVH